MRSYTIWVKLIHYRLIFDTLSVSDRVGLRIGELTDTLSGQANHMVIHHVNTAYNIFSVKLHIT